MRLVYEGLWCFADDAGRFEWEMDLIRADLFPFGCRLTVDGPELDLENTIERLQSVRNREGKPCVVKYTVAGRHYGFLPNFAKHQKPNRPTESKLPAPPERRKERAKRPHVQLTEDALLEGEREEEKDREMEREGERAAAAPPAAGAPPPQAEQVLTEARRDYERLREDPWDASEKARARDLAAASACLERAAGDAEEVGIRWRTALVHKGWPRIDTLRELEQHWSRFGNPPEHARQRLRQMQAGGAS
jgi:hypothetical protein